MTYERQFTREQRIEREGNIPGSIGWVLKKNNGVFPNKSITRNTHKFTTRTKKIKHAPDYYEQALKNGWTYNEETQTWKHPSYMHSFPSIFQTLYNKNFDTFSPLPYHNNEDELGLAYNCTTSCSGQRMNIFPNKWQSEEFDTRRGRRRELWRHKIEMRKKYSLQFKAYKENNKDNITFQDHQRDIFEDRNDDYNREFKINQ
tara:strand:- start:476 stop:1081 length:606 start_codon:yes stop_codon:yes gene_type:complete